jgi:hypothetical protein
MPIELSGLAIAAIFAGFTLVAVALTWAVCAIVDEWEEMGADKLEGGE